MLLFSPSALRHLEVWGRASPFLSRQSAAHSPTQKKKNNRHSLHQQAKKSYLRRLEVTTCSTGGGERIRILPSPICMRGMHYPPPLQNRPQCIPPPFFFPHVVATDLLLPQKYAPHSFATQWGKIKAAAAETPAGGKEKRRRDGTQGAHFPEFCFPSPKRKE